MPTTNPEGEPKQTGSLVTKTGSKSKKSKRRKRKLSSCSSGGGYFKCGKHKKLKGRSRDNYVYESICSKASTDSFYDSNQSDRFVNEEKFIWDKVKPFTSSFGREIENNISENSSERSDNVDPKISSTSESSKCWINELPQEILLKIFSYLPLGMLLHTMPQVCKKWETLSWDWTLWKTVEDLTIRNMVISTSKLRTLLRTIPKLRKLELILRNDTEELLHELFESHQNLEVLKLDRCYRSTLQMNILSKTVTSILEFCPRLKTVILTDTYFRGKNFYRCLAKKFRTIERIKVTCTTKSEMDVFMENLKENVSEVEFQRVPMMGRAEGKQIYWGPILGLVVRPIPTSPFHQQYIHDNYPNYAF